VLLFRAKTILRDRPRAIGQRSIFAGAMLGRSAC
jgi:hypothetical protein